MSEFDLRLLRMADKEDSGRDLVSCCLLAGALLVTVMMLVAVRLAN
jgi:hypothetical protein